MRNLLVVGSGGREHAIVWKSLQSPNVKQVFVAPGNGGLAKYSISINVTEIEKLADFAKKNDCLTIVGPEIPLSLGIVDYFKERSLSIFGPTKDQARLETSKAFAKSFMRENGIPTPDFQVFDDPVQALNFAKSFQGRVVVKADGLAAGKGVFVCKNIVDAEEAIRNILEKKIFGESGRRVVVEERVQGREVSVMALCDGGEAIPFGTATDHKRLYDGNEGPNTGGMGAYSPSLDFDEEAVQNIMDTVIAPTVRKTGFRGFLFAGLMLTKDSSMVLEFNARLGDPETQAILPRLESDLVRLILIAIGEVEGQISKEHLEWSKLHSCSVAMCTSGYPDKPRIGDPISGLENPIENQETIIFHAGTRIVGNTVFTNGGRVLYVTSTAESLEKASARAYATVKQISWKGEHHRNDIGLASSI